MLGRRRKTLVLALAVLSLSTILALLPPAATKLVIDYAFTGEALPASVSIMGSIIMATGWSSASIASGHRDCPGHCGVRKCGLWT